MKLFNLFEHSCVFTDIFALRVWVNGQDNGLDFKRSEFLKLNGLNGGFRMR